MKTRFALAALFIIATTLCAFSQVTQEERAKKSDQILIKMRKLDLMNQMLPLLLTKDQMRKILPAVEKGRQAVREQEKLEFDYLRKLEPKVDEALKEAEDKGKVPTRELLKEAITTFTMFGLKRRAVADDNADLVLKAFNSTLDAGQRKVAMNLLDPSASQPGIDVKSMKDDDKVRFYVKFVILDPLAYDILLQMSK